MVKRQVSFANNYGYGPFGVSPQNGGFDSFGYYRNKFSNNGLSPSYSYATYRNYYFEFNAHRSRYGQPAPTDYDTLKQEKNGEHTEYYSSILFIGAYYADVWGYRNHSPYWFGRRK